VLNKGEDRFEFELDILIGLDLDLHLHWVWIVEMMGDILNNDDWYNI
jgi:hypothetical protein